MLHRVNQRKGEKERERERERERENESATPLKILYAISKQLRKLSESHLDFRHSIF